MSRGFVATPDAIVKRMVGAVRPGIAAQRGLRVLEPGCGACNFLTSFATHYARRAVREGLGPGWVASRLRGVEMDPGRAGEARRELAAAACAEGIQLKSDHLDRMVVEGDFLEFAEKGWDIVIGNPPYVRLEGMTVAERKLHRARFKTARQRYDLYFLFLERGVRLLAPGGRLSFITPQKYMRVWSGKALRHLIRTRRIDAIELLPEDSFGGYVTYPAITRIRNEAPPAGHRVVVRQADGNVRRVGQSKLTDEPWVAVFTKEETWSSEQTLRDVAESIGVGVATGADAAYRVEKEEEAFLPTSFVRRTVSGRHLPASPSESIQSWETLLWPYDSEGRVVGPDELGRDAPKVLERLTLKKPRLERRTCAKRPGRDWYEFHERPRARDYARTKILVPDIQLDPVFRVDQDGLVPRHSVYYIVPKKSVDAQTLCDYLNSDSARSWLRQNCQPAAGGRIRVQSRVLAQLPIPKRISESEVSIPDV